MLPQSRFAPKKTSHSGCIALRREKPKRHLGGFVSFITIEHFYWGETWHYYLGLTNPHVNPDIC